MRTTGVLSLQIILSFGAAVHAQSVPVSSQVQIATDVFANGAKVATHIRSGNYYRRADGSVLEQWLVSDGDAAHPTAVLTDVTAGATYQLNLATHTATVHSGMTVRPITAKAASGAVRKPIGKSTVAGIACSIYAVKPASSGAVGAGSAVGQTCISDSLGLVLSRDLTYTGADGRTYHEVYVMTAVQPNAAPPAAAFDLSGFALQAAGGN